VIWQRSTHKKYETGMMPADPSASHGSASESASRPLGEIDRMLAETVGDLAALPLPDADAAHGVRQFEFREFSEALPRSATSSAAQQDAELDLKIELGRTQVSRDDLPELRGGSVISLDRMVHEPVDLVVDGQIMARGEVMVLDERFCVRITELFLTDETRASA
jgi:flagellar motor switch protein FliN/FliY